MVHTISCQAAKRLSLFAAFALLASCAASSSQNKTTELAKISEASASAKYSLRVRVYAGLEYRQRQEEWKKELDIVLARSSALLAPCDLRLELVEAPMWKRSGGALPTILSTLIAQDPGADVDLVIGFVDAPREAEVQMEQLVLTKPFSKHLVVRSFNRQAAAQSASMGALSEAEQDRALDEAARHKQSVVLAHGIAESFAASHAGSKTIDGPVYQPKLHLFSDAACKRLSLVAPAYIQNTEEAWTQVIAALGNDTSADVLDAAKTRKNGLHAPVSKENTMRDLDRERLLSSQMLLEQNNAEEAWASLEPLIELYPKNAEVATLACKASQARGGEDARSHCQMATRVAAKEASNWISLGELRIETNPRSAAKALERGSLGIATGDEAAWSRVAQGYRQLFMPTRAQKAASQAPSLLQSQIDQWAQEMKLRYGASTNISESEEGPYLRQLQVGLQFVYKQEYEKANALSAAMQSSYATSIAQPLLKCEIGLRKKKYKAALKACEKVLGLQPGNSWALYLSGVIHLRQTKSEQGIVFLQKALQVDPTLQAAFIALETTFKKNQDARLGPLQERFGNRFAPSP